MRDDMTLCGSFVHLVFFVALPVAISEMTMRSTGDFPLCPLSLNSSSQNLR